MSMQILASIPTCTIHAITLCSRDTRQRLCGSYCFRASRLLKFKDGSMQLYSPVLCMQVACAPSHLHHSPSQLILHRCRRRSKAGQSFSVRKDGRVGGVANLLTMCQRHCVANQHSPLLSKESYSWYQSQS